jgi:methanesulfonate monooxygenase subunit alpha
MAARRFADRDRPPDLKASDYVGGAVYSDEGVFQTELDQVLGKVWHFACHESEIPNVGDYRTFQHATQPLLVIRGEDGSVRCFFNVCSHRGARLLGDAAGNASRLTCFYHLWSYDTAGRCVDIPREEGYAPTGLDKSALGLREVRAETRSGLVFVSLDDAAPPLGDFLGQSLEIFDGVFGDDTVEYEVFHFHRGTVAANWKAWQETIVDLYHEFMHVVLRTTQMTAAPMTERDMRTYPNGHLAIGGLKADYHNYKAYDARDDSKAFPGLTVEDARFTPLFPDTTIITRGTVMRIDTVTPIDAHRTIVESRGLGIKGEPEADRLMRIRHHNDYWGPFGRNVPEDAFAAEACEKAFGSGAARFQIIARDEGGQGQDDLMLRSYYQAWADMTGRPHHNPVND